MTNVKTPVIPGRMPVRSFTVQYNGLTNILRTKATVSSGFDPAKTNTPPLQYQFNAIWDTGATQSVISADVVKTCGLKPVGIANVYTAAGPTRSNIYLVNIGLMNKVEFVLLRVTEGSIGGADILIGMDIINKGDFALTHRLGKTTFSFRLPSTEYIDFVKQPIDPPATVKKTSPKVGRNAPCPCGSGLKYKKCCGK